MFFFPFSFFLLCKYACLHTNLSCYTSSVISTVHRPDCCTPWLGLSWTKMCGFCVFKTSSGHMALHLVCDCFSAANTNDKSEPWKWHEICHTGRWRGWGAAQIAGAAWMVLFWGMERGSFWKVPSFVQRWFIIQSPPKHFHFLFEILDWLSVRRQQNVTRQKHGASQ